MKPGRDQRHAAADERPQATRSPGSGALAALEGVSLIVGHLIATPFIGRKRLRWGTVGTEAGDPMPGDSLVPRPKWEYTLGVPIDAPPERIWPWIAQLGQGRGGFYTYQSLENLLGCEIVNTTVILPDHQYPAVGDGIRLAATTPPLRVEIVEPPNTLVLFGTPGEVGSGSQGSATWQFAIRHRPEGGSRLLTRGRYDHGPNWKDRLMFGRFPLEAISFVMSRKMMLEIKRLAECDRKPAL